MEPNIPGPSAVTISTARTNNPRDGGRGASNIPGLPTARLAWTPEAKRARPRTELASSSAASHEEPCTQRSRHRPACCIYAAEVGGPASDSKAWSRLTRIDRKDHLASGRRPQTLPENPRRHPEAQIARLMRMIERVWTSPILIDETGTILAGHARLEAAKRLGLTEVPTLTIAGLSEAEKRAVAIADNRLPELAVWDLEILQEHFKALIDLDFDVELSGFSTGEIDLVLDGKPTTATDPADDLTGVCSQGPAVSQPGDSWEMGRHRLVCGDALQNTSYAVLLGGERAQMLLADPPYNVRINGHAMGRGKVRHREFAMASGEMSEPAFTAFLDTFMRHGITFSQDGSIHYLFIDWRHLPELLTAARPLYADWKNLLVWNKTNAGQCSFYRSKHELIAVFKNGAAAHVNNFGLGAQGRYRANVIDYPGVNCLHPARRGDLDLHPTVKPVGLVADLIRDCSRRKEIVLDPFAGSGTTILAAERAGRVARAIELDPLYVDVAIRRWEQITNIPVRHAESGLSFAEIAIKRGGGHIDSGGARPRRSRRKEAD